MEIVEARSLSDDGNTFTVDLSYKGSSSHWMERRCIEKKKIRQSHARRTNDRLPSFESAIATKMHIGQTKMRMIYGRV
jgi:hypothetical protein